MRAPAAQIAADTQNSVKLGAVVDDLPERRRHESWNDEPHPLLHPHPDDGSHARSPQDRRVHIELPRHEDRHCENVERDRCPDVGHELGVAVEPKSK